MLVSISGGHKYVRQVGIYSQCYLLDGGESMCNGDDCTSLHQSLQRLLHQTLTFGIQGTALTNKQMQKEDELTVHKYIYMHK